MPKKPYEKPTLGTINPLELASTGPEFQFLMDVVPFALVAAATLERSNSDAPMIDTPELVTWAWEIAKEMTRQAPHHFAEFLVQSRHEPIEEQ